MIEHSLENCGWVCVCVESGNMLSISHGSAKLLILGLKQYNFNLLFIFWPRFCLFLLFLHLFLSWFSLRSLLIHELRLLGSRTRERNLFIEFPVNSMTNWFVFYFILMFLCSWASLPSRKAFEARRPDRTGPQTSRTHTHTLARAKASQTRCRRATAKLNGRQDERLKVFNKFLYVSFLSNQFGNFFPKCRIIKHFAFNGINFVILVGASVWVLSVPRKGSKTNGKRGKFRMKIQCCIGH